MWGPCLDHRSSRESLKREGWSVTGWWVDGWMVDRASSWLASMEASEDGKAGWQARPGAAMMSFVGASPGGAVWLVPSPGLSSAGLGRVCRLSGNVLLLQQCFQGLKPAIWLKLFSSRANLNKVCQVW